MKNIQIVNQHNASEVLRLNKKPVITNLYRGSAEDNKKSVSASPLNKSPIMSKGFDGKWTESVPYAENMQKIEDIHRKIVNAANPPDQTTLEEFFGRFFLDITRRAEEAGDLTPMFNTEVTNPNFPEVVYLRDLKKFVGKFQTISGTNDTVPLIDQDTGNLRTVSHEIHALGWKSSLKNILYNDFYSLQKVLEAVADADADLRNSKTIGTIIGATFVASQTQAADATGTSFDTKMYNTIRKAIKKLRNLKDPQTDRRIAVPSINILCNPDDAWDIRRVVNGQLQGVNGSGDIASANLTSLPIDMIVEYDQGRTNGYTWGLDTLSFPGVAAGTAYVYVPGLYSYTANKRLLTMEMGQGDTLELSPEKRAWYRVFGTDMVDLLGSSAPGTSLTGGYGAIVKTSLPSDS